MVNMISMVGSNAFSPPIVERHDTLLGNLNSTRLGRTDAIDQDKSLVLIDGALQLIRLVTIQ